MDDSENRALTRYDPHTPTDASMSVSNRVAHLERQAMGSSDFVDRSNSQEHDSSQSDEIENGARYIESSIAGPSSPSGGNGKVRKAIKNFMLGNANIKERPLSNREIGRLHDKVKKQGEDLYEQAATIRKLEDRYESARRTAERRKEHITKQDSRVQTLEDSLRERRDDLNQAELALRKTKADHKQELLDAEERHRKNIEYVQSDNSRESQKQAEEHLRAVNDLEDKMKANNLESNRIISNWRNTMESSDRQHQKDLADMQADWENRLKSLKEASQAADAKAEQERQHMTETHMAEISRLTHEHRTASERLQRAREDSEAKLRTSFAESKSKYEETISKLQQDMQRERDAAAETYNQKEAQLITEHRENSRYLEQQVQELNKALLSRDAKGYEGSLFKASDLPKRPDNKLKELFSELQQLTEDLGRLSWKTKQPFWTDQIMARVVRDRPPKAVKKSIVQDMIWTLLYQAIFSSPFHIFGEEGRALEREWYDQCKQVDLSTTDEKYPWPAPGLHAERWRYMTIRECREALKQPSSIIDPRTRLRKDFATSTEDLNVSLKRELRSMVEVGVEELKIIDRLAKRAPAIWIDFQMHRCRIVARLAEDGLRSQADKVARLQNGPLKLTVSPMLGRYGSANGTELDRFVTIGGCGGEHLEVP